MKRHRRLTLLVGLPVVVATAAAFGLGALAQGGPTSAPVRKAKPLFHLHADHATYSSVTDLRKASDVIIEGAVLSATTNPGTSLGTDPAGNPLPALPSTDYAVRVDRQLKGGFGLTGQTVAVSLSGGGTSAGDFVLDGGPVLARGNVALFFLQRGDDGKYYPVAGGAAIAQRQADGSFAISHEVTGQQDELVTEEVIAPRMSVQVHQAFLDVRRAADRAGGAIIGNYQLPAGVTFSCGQEVDFALNAPTVTDTIAGNKFSSAGPVCIYQASRAMGPIQALTLDLLQRRFIIHLRGDANVAKLTNPVTFQLQLGVSQGAEQLPFNAVGDFWFFLGLGR
jgi:hypothetical protein